MLSSSSMHTTCGGWEESDEPSQKREEWGVGEITSMTSCLGWVRGEKMTARRQHMLLSKGGIWWNHVLEHLIVVVRKKEWSLHGRLRGYCSDPGTKKGMPDPLTENMKKTPVQLYALVVSLDKVAVPGKLLSPFRACKTADWNLKHGVSVGITWELFQRKKLCSLGLPGTCRLRTWRKLWERWWGRYLQRRLALSLWMCHVSGLVLCRIKRLFCQYPPR